MKKYRGRILMLLENPFPRDPRVRHEARTLAQAEYKVYIIAQKKTKGTKVQEEIDGVTVYRLPSLNIFRKSFSGISYFQHVIFRITSCFGYILEYLYFTAACWLMSLYILIRHGFDALHINNPPDMLFIIGAFYKVLGKKIIFDHHDLAPELYLAKYNTKDIVYSTLLLEERLCLRLADIVIATNNSYKKVQIERAHIDSKKIYIVRNGPDPREVYLQSPNPSFQRTNRSIICYAGAMNVQDGVDYLIRSLKYLRYGLGRKDFYCILMGTGDAFEKLQVMTADFQLNDYVQYTGFLSIENLMPNLSLADICVAPEPSSPLNDVSTFIKIMEYMALGKPIVSFDLRESRYSAQDAAIYATPNDEQEFAKAIETLMDNPVLRSEMGEFGRKRVEQELSWPHVSKNLLLAYKEVFNHSTFTVSDKE